MTTYCSDVRQETLLEDDIAVGLVLAVKFRSMERNLTANTRPTAISDR